jgi:glycosyltransferase involved in cell wall biosynthesis
MKTERPPVSVTIITLNEAASIARAITSVAWAEEVLVVDSGSSDDTVKIATGLGARVLHNPWPGYGQQKNFAQKNATHDWVLNIDGDEAVSPGLADEIERELGEIQAGRSKLKGFRFPRKNFYIGRWIRFGGWYPNYLVRLADRRTARWTEPHVHEALGVSGPVGTLEHPLLNYSFDSIECQIQTNLRFARLGAQELERKRCRPSRAKLLLKPVGKFLETFVIKRGFLDGLPGFIISINAAHSIFLKYAYLLEPKIDSSVKPRETENEDPHHR